MYDIYCIAAIRILFAEKQSSNPLNLLSQDHFKKFLHPRMVFVYTHLSTSLLQCHISSDIERGKLRRVVSFDWSIIFPHNMAAASVLVRHIPMF